jgi:hypothetical protein
MFRTRLVDTVTTPMLLKTVQSHRIAAAAKTNALKVLIEA